MYAWYYLVKKKIPPTPILGPFGARFLGLFLTEIRQFWALKLVFWQDGQGAPTDDEYFL